MKLTRELQKELVAEKQFQNLKESNDKQKAKAAALNKKYAARIKKFIRLTEEVAKLTKEFTDATGDIRNGIYFNTYGHEHTFHAQVNGNLHEDDQLIESWGRQLYLEAAGADDEEVQKLIKKFLEKKI